MKSLLNGLHLPIRMLLANKKRSLGLIGGFLIGLICMISSLFAFFAFDLGVTKRISGEKVYSTFSIQYENKTRADAFDALEDCAPTEFINVRRISLKYYYSYINNARFFGPEPTYEYPTITIDGRDYLHDYDFVTSRSPESTNFYEEQVLVYDTELSATIITEEEEAYCRKRGGKALVAGRESLERGEIMVAADLLDYFKINYEDAVGKKISLRQKVKCGSKTYFGEESLANYDGTEEYAFKDFTISGVYSTLLRYSPFRNDGVDERYLDFWISEKSLYTTDKIKRDDETGKIEFSVHPHEIFAEANESKMLFGYLGLNSAYDRYSDGYTIFMQLPSFSRAFNLYNALKERFSDVRNVISAMANTALDAYIYSYPYYEIALYVVIIFTVLLVFVTILNVFVLIGYNVKKNRGFNTMLKAVGMTNGGVIKVYLAQIIILFLMAVLLATLFTSVLAAVALSKLNVSVASVYGDGFALSFVLYLPAWAISVVGVLALLVVASLLGIIKNNRANIVRVSQEQ